MHYLCSMEGREVGQFCLSQTSMGMAAYAETGHS